MRTRYGIFFLAGAVLCAALAAGLGLASHRSHAAAKPRPNILVLETDDQTLDEMLPNVRRLIGDQGVTFDQNFDSGKISDQFGKERFASPLAGVIGRAVKPPETA